MSYSYKTTGTCSQIINFDVIDNKLTSVDFVSGCHGNLQGISKLVEGMDVDEVIRRLKNINCKEKGTSCPDQLANALEQYKQSLADQESGKEMRAAEISE